MKSFPILLAEDDKEDQMLTRMAFEQANLKNPIICVENGVDLIKYLKRENPYSDDNLFPYPGLILLDLNMPIKTGIEALIEIKNDPDIVYIPIIILTTSNQEEEILKSYTLGASSFISKPGEFSKMVEIIKNLGNYWLRIVETPND